MPAQTDNARANYVRKTRKGMFDSECPLTRGRSLGLGALMGSAVTVVMLALSLAIGAAFGQWNEGMAYCLSFIIAGVAGGVLQQAWFNPGVSLRLKYPARMCGFAFTYLVVLAGCACLGSWLPMHAAAWVEFVGTFAVFFAIISLVFSLRYRKEGGTYNELLAEYRAKREGGGQGQPHD